MNTFNRNGLEQIADYCKTYWAEDVLHRVRIADEVSQNTFLFDLRWDMERTYEPFTFKDEVIWDYDPFGDEEWVCMLNRHRYFTCLGQAYTLTKDEKYVEAFIRLLEHWIDNAKLTPESTTTTWRTIEVGIRIENWIKAYNHMGSSPLFTETLRKKFFDALKEQGDYLCQVYDGFRILSNWGILQNQGLFLLGCFMSEEPLGQGYLELAIERIAKQLAVQVMADGVHWEQSPMYHNEVLHCLLNIIWVAKINHISLPTIIETKAKAMCYANLYWAKPNHHQICQSDSDDTDVRDLLTKGAYLFKDEYLKFGAYKTLDFESAWDMGLEAINGYNQLGTKMPLSTSCALSDSGNYYFRESWKEESPFLHFRCGALGSGHGHADLLHIDLFAYGEDILIDNGRYTYTETEERMHLKSPFAHNTTVVDHRPFTEPIASWDYGKIAKYLKGNFYSTPEYDYVSGSHLGYLDLANGSVLTTRKVIYIKPDIFILVDSFEANGVHDYEQLYHFNNEGDLTEVSTLGSPNVQYKGNKASMQMVCVTPGTAKETFKSKLSRHYNLIEDSKGIKFSLCKEGFTTIITAITVDPKDSVSCFNAIKVPVSYARTNDLAEDYEAEGVVITKDDREYTLVLRHEDATGVKALLGVKAYISYGEVVMFNKQGEMTVLA